MEGSLSAEAEPMHGCERMRRMIVVVLFCLLFIRPLLCYSSLRVFWAGGDVRGNTWEAI
jgi:hypothetical protein